MTIDPTRIETVRHASSAGVWELVRCRPDVRLAPYVRDYHGYRETTATIIRRIEITVPAAVVILNFGPDWNLATGDRPMARHGSFVAGLSSTYAVSENTGASHCLQFNLTPLGARLLLGLPLRHITDRIVDMADILGRDGERLAAQMAELPDWPERFTFLDHFILKRIAAASSVHPGVLQAWSRIASSAGRVSVAALAAEVEWSRKHLTARLHDEIGLPPATLSRLLRFRAVIARLGSGPVRWSELALDCGYFDQAHLIRDFRRFTGMTPGEFMRRRIGDGFGLMDERDAA